MNYLQVRYAPADRTKDARAMMADAILAFFTKIASISIKAMSFANQTCDIRFAKTGIPDGRRPA